MDSLELEGLKDALVAAVDGAAGGTDGPFRSEGAALAAAYRAAGDGLLGPAVRWDHPPPAPREWVGPYRILGVLGAGGMGVVYRAEQLEPVRRPVAVKVLRCEVASPAALAGFHVERHALARLCHRNVAVVLDAGVADGGQPFLVMDLVAGPPVDRYADARRLGPRDRLALFAAVCRGVHHAHQRGVVHRDLKPGNVLVVEEDGRAVPKVIDFGVAKLLADPAAAGPAPPGASAGGLVGTLEYMSPELARHGLAAVDARSDVYGLGAILFELLAGGPPFDPAALRRGGLADALAAIGRGPPAPPSRAARPGVVPPVAPRAVAGELDWVVGRATDPDPDRRYASAAALADDVERFLDGRPVEAAPPSRWYAARKFARRNAAPVAAAAAALLALAAGAGMAAAGLHQARLDRDRWRAASAEASRATVVAEAAGARAASAQREAEAAIDVMGDALLTAHDGDPAAKGHLADLGRRAGAVTGLGTPASARARLRIDLLLGQTHQQAGRLDQADEFLTRAHAAGEWAGPRDRVGAAVALSELRVEQRRAAEGLALADEAVRHAAAEEDGRWRVRAGAARANALVAAGRAGEAADLLAAVIAGDGAGPAGGSGVARCQVLLGAVRARLKQWDAAEAATRAGRAAYHKLYGPSHRHAVTAGYNLAQILSQRGRPAEAVPVLEETLDGGRRTLGPAHPVTLSAAVLLGRCCAKVGRDDEAAKALRDALAAGDEASGDKNPVGPSACDGLMALHRKHGRHPEAVAAARDMVRYAAARDPIPGWPVARFEVDLASTLADAGRPAEAAAVAVKAHAALAGGPADLRQVGAAAARVAAAAYAAAGDPARAEEWRARAAR